ncbi:MAG: GntR family transcriptional regulator [Chitinivibrionales bacterium]|nr:GntR family transcriptional regulator [Chitinivibrionales bacterium]
MNNHFVPIYKRLFEKYRDMILNHQLAAGDRIDSINEIQKIHNVSRETAKIVLKLLASDGYIVQHPGKGSFVADLRPREKIWGIILPFYSAQYEALFQHILNRAATLDRELRLFVDNNSWEEEIRLVGKLIGEACEAVIVVPTLDESKTAEFYRRLSPRESFVILADHTMAGSFFSYVVQSYDLGLRRALEYLLDKCNGTVAFVRNITGMGRNLVQELMEGTYIEIMESERPRRQQCILDRLSSINADVVRKQNIQGLFCCDDGDALRITGRLREQGISMGTDLHLVSYGNTEFARFMTPSITSIDPHPEAMAQKIVAIIQDHLSGGRTDMSQYVMGPELVVRDT